MRLKVILAIGFSILGSTVSLGQTQAPPAPAQPAGIQRSLQALQDPKEAAVLATCKNPPPPAQRPPGAPGQGGPPAPAPGPRDYTIAEIPGVLAAGQHW